MFKFRNTKRAPVIARLRIAAGAALATALTVIAVAPAEANDPSTPEWPCVWRKFVTLDAATIWDGPPIDKIENWRNDDKIRNLSQFLIRRRIPLEEVEKNIKDYAQSLDKATRDAQLTRLFAAVLDRSNDDRKIVVAGIERFHKRQLARAKEIEKEGLTLPPLEEGLITQPVEATEVDKLTPEEEGYKWDVRVFQERQRNIPLACEIPQLMDERTGAVARAIRAEMLE